ncbi:Aromatic amino acid beta-eliminating lyase/threonine aldolase [Desulfovibrio ferrophilus]|uniref:Aromatic amino acid beta-eliminating lyase/threonine aldolase n=1 Tax=Desulfovibrio ferrophilus TaxID=241368 RepID=A0A2Z6B349_9BACT|nr:Aromatic amino acid beta-eliminating lyase/threonine aldolase [Desulfovibrio ferrophilus]
MAEANAGHCVAYGSDPYTEAAREAFKDVFGPQTEPFFVFNGTGANVSSLAALTRSWNAAICSDCAHINVDECGAPERGAGIKLLAERSVDGKIDPRAIERHLHCLGSEHHSQPVAVSLTQATELGTVYTAKEIKDVADRAHEAGMAVHMDGARLANAAEFLGLGLKELTTDCGVDVLSFGGTKNGLMFGEAVVFLNPEHAETFKYIRKQSMQLHSKMRYIAAQYVALLSGDLWLENARNANAMARLLAKKISSIPGVDVTRPVETNGVFATLAPELIEPLREQFFFYTWDEELPEVRWMCSFDTTEEDVLGFVRTLAEVVAGQ